MTQMVMSRGVPHSLPDAPASLRYGKGHFLTDNEDVMVMDTKLKIIEILQVRRHLLDEFLGNGGSRWLRSLADFDFWSVRLLVHPQREVGLQDYVLVVHLQEGVWRKDYGRQQRLRQRNAAARV